MSFSIQKCKENNSECSVILSAGNNPACEECVVQTLSLSEAQCSQQQENEDLGEVLIEKLTKEELTLLCEAHDDGSIETIFYDHLYPEDSHNYPEKYVTLDDGAQEVQE